MRSSADRRTKRAAIRRRRLHIGLALLLVTALCGLFLAYTNWRVSADIHDRESAQKTLFAKLDAQAVETKKQKVIAAKKAEAEAKAAAAATEAQRKADAAANPSGASTSTTATACDVTNPARINVVVNKKHCFNPMTWAPDDLSAVAKKGYYMRAEAATAMQTMMDAASNVGQGFLISSAYRSYYDQVATYNYWVEVNGSQAEADKVSARAGYSDHQTGLTADLKLENCVLECFGTTTQYQWLATHAAEYGFIRRYPEGLTSITGYEPEAWHWRYVGIATAQDMKTKGIETLEQYLGITGGDY